MKLYSRKKYDIIKKTILADKGESHCPFCDIDSQEEFILWRGKYWYIQHNKYPLAGLSQHLLAIPYKCTRFTKNLSQREWAEFQKVEEFMYNFYADGNYFSFVREIGKIKSVHHLHYHFLPGEMECKPLIDMLRGQGFKSDI